MNNRNLLLNDACKYINSWLEYKIDNTDLPGLAIGIRSESEDLLAKSYGLANLNKKTPLSINHNFRIASHSKMFTSIAIYQLAEQGKLKINDRVAKHLLWFKSDKDSRVKNVTIQNLLNHFSGIFRDGDEASFWDYEREFPDLNELKRYVKNAKLAFAPNKQPKYSNTGYAILGELITEISGIPYNEYVVRNIIKPSKLNNTGPEIDKNIIKTLASGYSRIFHGFKRQSYSHINTKSYSSAAGFYSNVKDLCKFGSNLYFGNQKILSDKSKISAFKPAWYQTPKTGGYASGYSVFNYKNWKLIGHGGSLPGFSTYTLVEPKEKLVITVLTNSQDAPAQMVCYGIIKILNYFLKEGNFKNTTKRNKLKKFESRLYSRGGIVDIVLVGEKLIAISPDLWNPTDDITELGNVVGNKIPVTKTNPYGIPGESLGYKFNTNGKIDHVYWGSFIRYTKDKFLKKNFN